MGNQLTATAPSQIFTTEHFFNGLSNISFEKQLGTTRFLKVAKGRYIEGPVTVKIFVSQDVSISLKSYREDIDNLKLKLENIPWCLPYEKTLIIDDRIGYLIREYTKYNLYDRLNTRPFLILYEKKWIAYQLLSALDYLNSLGVYHSDLKCENVLLTSWNWLLLSDFASFKPVTLPDDNPSDFSYYYDTSRRRTCYVAPERFVSSPNLPLGNQQLFGESTAARYDTSPFAAIDVLSTLESTVAPEIEIERWRPPYSSKGVTVPSHASDIFSAGCVLLEFFSDGTPPFYLAQLLAFKNGRYFPTKVVEKVLDPNLRTILLLMISPQPGDRPTARQCIGQLMGNGYFSSKSISCSDKISTKSSFPALANYVHGLNELSSDVRIARLVVDLLSSTEYPKDGNSEEKNVGEKFYLSELTASDSVIFLQLILSCLDIREEDNSEQSDLSPKRLKYRDGGIKFQDSYGGILRLISALAPKCPTRVVFDRIIPSLIYLITGPNANPARDRLIPNRVRCQALDLLTDILYKIPSAIEPEDANVFIDYIIPKLSFAMSGNHGTSQPNASTSPSNAQRRTSHLPGDTIFSIKMALTRNVARLAEVAARFWEQFYLRGKQEPTLEVDQGISSEEDQAICAVKSQEIISWETYLKVSAELERSFQNLIVHHLLSGTGTAGGNTPTSPIAYPFSNPKLESYNVGSDRLLKRAFLSYSAVALCPFFGPNRAHEVILSHAITFLNDKTQPDLRADFFVQLPGIVVYAGPNLTGTIHGDLLLPLLQQGLRDVQERVILKAIQACAALLQAGLIEVNSVEKLNFDLLPFLHHPTLRLRRAVCGYLAILNDRWDRVDVFVKLMPLLLSYLKAPILRIPSEKVLFASLQDPIPRAVYGHVIKCTGDLNFVFGAITRDVQLFSKFRAKTPVDHYEQLMADMAAVLCKVEGGTQNAETSAARLQSVDPARGVNPVEADQVISKLMSLGYRPEDGPKLLRMRTSIIKIATYTSQQPQTPQLSIPGHNKTVDASNILLSSQGQNLSSRKIRLKIVDSTSSQLAEITSDHSSDATDSIFLSAQPCANMGGDMGSKPQLDNEIKLYGSQILGSANQETFYGSDNMASTHVITDSFNLRNTVKKGPTLRCQDISMREDGGASYIDTDDDNNLSHNKDLQSNPLTIYANKSDGIKWNESKDQSPLATSIHELGAAVYNEEWRQMFAEEIMDNAASKVFDERPVVVVNDNEEVFTHLSLSSEMAVIPQALDKAPQMGLDQSAANLFEDALKEQGSYERPQLQSMVHLQARTMPGKASAYTSILSSSTAAGTDVLAFPSKSRVKLAGLMARKESQQNYYNYYPAVGKLGKDGLEGYSPNAGNQLGPSSWELLGTLVTDIYEHSGPITQIKTSPNNSIFASASNVGEVKIWNVSNINTTGLPLKSSFSRQHPGTMCKCLTWLDESLLVASYTDSTIRTFHLNALRASEVKVFDSINLPSSCNSGGKLKEIIVDMAPMTCGKNGVILAATQQNGLIGLDLRMSTLAFRIDPSQTRTSGSSHHTNALGATLTMSFQPSSHFVLCGTSEGFHQCWDMRFHLPIATIPHPDGCHVRKVMIHPSDPSKFISCAGNNNEMAIWDVYGGVRERVFWASPNPPLTNTAVKSGNYMNDLIFGFTEPCKELRKGSGPRGSYLVASGSDGKIRRWDIENGRNSAILAQSYKCLGVREGVNRSSLLPAVKYETRMVEGLSVTLEVEDVDNSSKPDNIPYAVCDVSTGHRDSVTSLAFARIADSNCGISLNHTFPSLLISGSYDGIIKIWK